MTNKDDEFEMRWHLGAMEKNPDNCKMCGYCTGLPGIFSFACLKED